MKDNVILKDWQKYLDGLEYNQTLKINGKGYYETIDANLAFANGDQWRNSKETGIPKFVFNIIKRVKQFKVASIASSNIAVKFEPLEYREDGTLDDTIIASEMITNEVNNVLDEFGIEHKQRDLLFDGFDTGDYVAHCIYDMKEPIYNGQYGDVRGKIKIEIVDGQNVMFGNPNCNDKEKQPYIIIVGRDLVSNLKEETKQNIFEDTEYQYMAGDYGKIEIKGDETGKALYIILYKKDKKGQVLVSKLTADTYIYKDVPMGINKYPIAFGNWEKIKNCYHGRAETTGIIPNQIALNKIFSMYAYHTSLNAYPTLIYDKKAVGGQWTSQIGVPIGVSLEQNQRIEDIAKYLQVGLPAGNISSVIELIKSYTQEMLGVNDAALGNINPENTSAIIAVQKATAIPLENVRSSFYQFLKELVDVIAEMIVNNYGVRPIVVEQEGNRNVVMYDFSNLKTIYMNSKLDIGPSGYYSDIATNNTLDNLLNAQFLTFIQYLERVDDSLIPDKQKLIEELKGAMQQNNIDQNEQMAQFFETLPPETQAQLKSLPDAQFEQAVMELMQQSMPQQNQPV